MLGICVRGALDQLPSHSYLGIRDLGGSLAIGIANERRPLAGRWHAEWSQGLYVGNDEGRKLDKLDLSRHHKISKDRFVEINSRRL